MKKVVAAVAASVIAVVLIGPGASASAAPSFDYEKAVYKCVKKEAGAKAAARFLAGKPKAKDMKVIDACQSTVDASVGAA